MYNWWGNFFSFTKNMWIGDSWSLESYHYQWQRPSWHHWYQHIGKGHLTAYEGTSSQWKQKNMYYGLWSIVPEWVHTYFCLCVNTCKEVNFELLQTQHCGTVYKWWSNQNSPSRNRSREGSDGKVIGSTTMKRHQFSASRTRLSFRSDLLCHC